MLCVEYWRRCIWFAEPSRVAMRRKSRFEVKVRGFGCSLLGKTGPRDGIIISDSWTVWLDEHLRLVIL